MERQVHDKDGSTYQGTMAQITDYHNKQTWVKHGHGMQTYENGDVYVGQWYFDRIQGEGNYKFQDGNVYDGEFYVLQGKKPGICKISYSKTSPYGDFLNDSGFSKDEIKLLENAHFLGIIAGLFYSDWTI